MPLSSEDGAEVFLCVESMVTTQGVPPENRIGESQKKLLGSETSVLFAVLVLHGLEGHIGLFDSGNVCRASEPHRRHKRNLSLRTPGPAFSIFSSMQRNSRSRLFFRYLHEVPSASEARANKRRLGTDSPPALDEPRLPDTGFIHR